MKRDERKIALRSAVHARVSTDPSLERRGFEPMAIAAAWNARSRDFAGESQERAWLDDGLPGTKRDDQVDATTRTPDYLREPEVVETTIKAFT